MMDRQGDRRLTKGLPRRACRKAGLRQIGWHVLRHTFASHLVMRGAAMKVVQELLGHATIEMTMRYAHLSPDVPRHPVNCSMASAAAPHPRRTLGDRWATRAVLVLNYSEL